MVYLNAPTAPFMDEKACFQKNCARIFSWLYDWPFFLADYLHKEVPVSMKKETGKKSHTKAMKNMDEEQQEQEAEAVSAQQKQINESGSVTTHCQGHTIHCLTVIGQIEIGRAHV